MREGERVAGPKDGVGDGVNAEETSPDRWVSVRLDCHQFTADVIVARLESEGIEIHRPTLWQTAGRHWAFGDGRGGQRIGFRYRDRVAVMLAVLDAGDVNVMPEW